MSVSDAKPMDVYVDSHGTLWRVVGIMDKPSVIMEQIEGSTKLRKHAAIGAPLWDGFRRIYRSDRPEMEKMFKDIGSMIG